MTNEANVTGERLVAGGRFISYKVLEWVDEKGVIREWESAERPHNLGAVLIIPRLMPSNRLLLIRQFRPPARAAVVEFPAGLMEPGEEPAVSAARELREETGYHAGKLTVYPSAFTTPGLASESVFMVTAEIDENAPENAEPETDFDPSEMIETLLVDMDDLADFYQRETARGTMFDAKLAAYICGLEAALP